MFHCQTDADSLLRREITFEENDGLESGSFFLTDTFRSPEASSSLTENFVFPVAPEIKGNKLLLTFDKEIYPFTVTVTLPEDAVLTVTPKVHVAHDGSHETVFIVRATFLMRANASPRTCRDNPIFIRINVS